MIQLRKIICKNAEGDELEIAYHPPYILKSIEGITGFKNNIILSNSGQRDGGIRNGAYVEPRHITMQVVLVQDIEYHTERLRGLFVPKELGTFYYYGDSYTRKIDYEVDNLDIPHTPKRTKTALISLTCSDPYFRDADEYSKNMAAKTPMISAPLALPPWGLVASVSATRQEEPVVNGGNKETGITITFLAKGPVSTPRLDNLTTGEYIKVDVDMEAGQQLTINTNFGHKAITLDGVNINNKKDRMSEFIQLTKGENILKYGADSGRTDLDVYLRWSAEYTGA